jgi:hypothetical protein
MLGSALKALVVDEARGWLPHIAGALVRSAVQRLPPLHRPRYEEEWLAELAAYSDRPLTALVRAADICRGAVALNATLRKRHRVSATDRLVATGGLIFVFPMLILLAGLIRLDSPGPVFHRQKRARIDGRIYTALRFRTTQLHAIEFRSTGGTLHQAPRLTRVGRMLRRTDLDYLPTLLSVARGDQPLRPQGMSWGKLVQHLFQPRDRED